MSVGHGVVNVCAFALETLGSVSSQLQELLARQPFSAEALGSVQSSVLTAGVGRCSWHLWADGQGQASCEQDTGNQLTLLSFCIYFVVPVIISILVNPFKYFSSGSM